MPTASFSIMANCVILSLRGKYSIRQAIYYSSDFCILFQTANNHTVAYVNTSSLWRLHGSAISFRFLEINVTDHIWNKECEPLAAWNHSYIECHRILWMVETTSLTHDRSWSLESIMNIEYNHIKTKYKHFVGRRMYCTSHYSIAPLSVSPTRDEKYHIKSGSCSA